MKFIGERVKRERRGEEVLGRSAEFPVQGHAKDSGRQCS